MTAIEKLNQEDYKGLVTILKQKEVWLGQFLKLKGILKKIDVKKSNTGSDFSSIILCDTTGTLIAKIWNSNLIKEGYIVGDAISGDFTVGTFNDQIQLSAKNTTSFVKLNEEEKMALLKKSPISYNKMKEYTRNVIHEIKDESLKEIARVVLTEYNQQLKYYPGGEIVHHAYYGGLFHHIYSMLKLAIAAKETEFEENCDDINFDLLITGIMVHDIGKFKCYDVDEKTGIATRNRQEEILGHLYVGAQELDRIVKEKGIQINPKMLDNLKHIILSHHYKPEYGSLIAPKFLEAEMVHKFDDMSSRFAIHKEVRANLEKGSSSKCYFLENRTIVDL